MENELEKTDERPRYADLARVRISIREYGSGELEAYLVRKGASEAVAEEIVRELVAGGWVDDRRFARVIARHQAFRGKGPQYVWAKLRQKGVDLPLSEVRAIYGECLPENVESELEAARRLLERRYPDASNDRAAAKRAYQALLRRGFSRDVAQKCVFPSKS